MLLLHGKCDFYIFCSVGSCVKSMFSGNEIQAVYLILCIVDRRRGSPYGNASFYGPFCRASSKWVSFSSYSTVNTLHKEK